MKNSIKFNAFIYLIIVIFGISTIFYFRSERRAQAFSMQDGVSSVMVVLDPGHGGVDGGALSKSGVMEKDVTLKIAKNVETLLSISGVSCVMTRYTDKSVHDPSALTVRAQKTSDLKNRVMLAKENPNSMFISIHANSFPDQSQKGYQVFYKGEGGKQKGNIMQKTLLEVVDDGNKRVAKEIDKNLYIFKSIENEAMLLECGFLSNKAEAILLGSEEYQQKLSFSIYLGILRCLNEVEMEDEK